MKALALLLFILVSIAPAYLAQTAQEFHQVARQAQKKIDYTGAVKLLNKAIELEPVNQQYYYERGLLFLELEKPFKANNDFDTAIRLDSMYINAYLGKSAYFLSVSQVDSAMYMAQMASILSDDITTQSQAQSAIADVYLAAGKDSLALNYFTESLLIDSANVSGYKKAAAVLSRLHRYEEANNYLFKAYTYDQRDLEILINLAFTFNRIGYYREALEYVNLALELDPHHPMSLSNRAYAYLQIDKPDLALQDIKKSLANDKSNPMSYRYAGEIYLAKENTKKACKNFKKAQKLGYASAFDDEVENHMATHCE